MVGPVIAPGAGGVGASVVVIHVGALVPHVFDAVTQMFPALAPKVTVMDVVP